MPRKKNLVPSLLWHKGKGRWYCTPTRGGKPVWFAADEATAQAEYRLWLAGHLAQQPVPQPVPQVGRRLSVAEFLLRWDQHNQGRITSRQHDRCRRAAVACERLFGGLPADDLEVRHVRQVRDELLRTLPGRRVKGQPTPPVSRYWVNALVQTLRTAWAWGASEGLVSAESAARVRALRGLRKGEGGRELPRREPPDAVAFAKAMAAMPPTVAAMVRLQHLTGMRPGEVCVLRPCDVSRDPNQPAPVAGQDYSVAAFDEQGVRFWLYCPGQHKLLKAGLQRIIVLDPHAQEVLRPYLARRQPQEEVFSPADAWAERAAQRGWDLSRFGRRQCAARFSVDNYNKAVARACARAGVPPWSPYQVRHLAITEAIVLAGWEAARSMAGHTSVKQTEGYFGTLGELRLAARESLRLADLHARTQGK